MENLPYELRAGQMNQTFERIKNCKVVKPTYDLNGFYSAEFMLDKRNGLESIFSDGNKNFLDYIDIKGIRYYFYEEGNNGFIGALEGSTFHVLTSGMPLGANSPRKIAYGRNIYGSKQGSGVIVAPEVGVGGDLTIQGMDNYTGGYVKFKYTGVSGIAVGDYILFTGDTSVLKGGLNRVEAIEGDYIFIIGTNARGSIPKVGDTFDLYKNASSVTSNCIMVGHNDEWSKGVVSMILLNGYNTANVVKVLKSDEQIIDIVNFDANIFVLTDTRMYFSRSTSDDNTQFYPLDNHKIDGGYKLFPMGKVLMAFGRQNKLFAAANATNQNVGYVGYDVNYNGDTFGKYSQIFSDQTIYILQEDLQLMQVDVVQNNTTTFDLAIKNILLNTRGVFEDIAGGDINIASSKNFLNFICVKDGTSTNYEFDKQYQHWIIQEYQGIVINKFGDHILCDGHICRVGDGYKDLGNDYEQEVNYMIVGGMKMYMPYTLRTIFGLVNSPIDVKLDMEFEIGGKSIPVHKRFNNFDVDNRLATTLSGDEIIGYDGEPYEVSEYNGTTISIQTNILRTGRYIRFKYNSAVRFCIGDTYIFADSTKPFINEINKGI